MKTHTEKCAKGKIGIEGRKSCDCDGYHTFDELYDHRVTLFIALCRVLNRESEENHARGAGDMMYRNGGIWRSKLHDDGSKFDGWFVLGIRTDGTKQITYHLPLSRWDETGFAYTFEKAPKWDGHTSDDVIKRLKLL